MHLEHSTKAMQARRLITLTSLVGQHIHLMSLFQFRLSISMQYFRYSLFSVFCGELPWTVPSLYASYARSLSQRLLQADRTLTLRSYQVKICVPIGFDTQRMITQALFLLAFRQPNSTIPELCLRTGGTSDIGRRCLSRIRQGLNGNRRGRKAGASC